MFDFVKEFFSHNKSKLDLKEFARIRENIKKEYTDEDIKNYALKLLKDNFYRYESVRNDEIIDKFQNCEKFHRVQFSIELKDICNHFLGLNNIEVLRILVETDFNKKAEELLIKCFGKEILDNITYKIEYETGTDYEYENMLEEKVTTNKYICLGYAIGSEKTVYIHLKLYFKY